MMRVNIFFRNLFLLRIVHILRFFTLMNLASSAANADLIGHNSLLKLTLEVALETHARDVGGMISTLLKRLTSFSQR